MHEHQKWRKYKETFYTWFPSQSITYQIAPVRSFLHREISPIEYLISVFCYSTISIWENSLISREQKVHMQIFFIHSKPKLTQKCQKDVKTRKDAVIRNMIGPCEEISPIEVASPNNFLKQLLEQKLRKEVAAPKKLEPWFSSYTVLCSILVVNISTVRNKFFDNL